jgi:hypothetical protein
MRVASAQKSLSENRLDYPVRNPQHVIIPFPGVDLDLAIGLRRGFAAL